MMQNFGNDAIFITENQLLSAKNIKDKIPNNIYKKIHNIGSIREI